jgi:hypothetical protein
MPLEQDLRNMIHAYCVRDLPGDLQWHVLQFRFIEDEELKRRLGRAFYSARYMAKLMEAMQATSDEVHAFVKFQITQYAAIYEAVISFLLWSKFAEHREVKALETHKAYKPVTALGSLAKMQYGAETVFTCVYRDSKTNRNSIPFKDKVDCAVRIGLVEEAYAEEIKHIYALRNLAHIETEAEKQIDVEIAQSKAGYWRLKPFLEKITAELSRAPV